MLTSKSPSGVCEQKTGRLLGTFTIIKVRRKLSWKRSIIPSRTEQPFLFSPLHACWEDPPIFSLALLLYLVGFSCGSAGKEFTCNAGDLGSIPRLERTSGEANGYPLQYSCLENSRDREARQTTVRAIAESDTTEQPTLHSHYSTVYTSLDLASFTQHNICEIYLFPCI